MRVDERQIARAQVTARTPAVAPERESVRGRRTACAARVRQSELQLVLWLRRPRHRRPPARLTGSTALIRQNGGQPQRFRRVVGAEPHNSEASPGADGASRTTGDNARSGTQESPRTAAERESAGTAAQHVQQNNGQQTIDRLTKRGRIIRSTKQCAAESAARPPNQHTAANNAQSESSSR